MKIRYNEDGYIIVKKLLSNEEVNKLVSSLEAEDSAVMAQSYEQDDGEGLKVRLSLWNQPGDDLTGMIIRSEKLVDTCTELMGGEIYHYHSKLVMKDPHTGGAFQWHQDYGYWYLNGLLFPDMISVQMGVDRMDRENGCLQVIKGSHRMGRIEHGRIGQQAGADLERVAEAQQVLETVYVELDPGDALFFHCNLLHKSNANHSPRRRWTMISCYNSASNNPVKEHHHASYTPLNKVPNSAIMDCTNLNDISGKWFNNPNKGPEYLPTKPRNQ
uniref:Phytanoyl-CoA dioxygenase family protein n=1 Tax=Ciona savignyi TaxID=51511 RepID=H2Z8R3_CIOSA